MQNYSLQNITDDDLDRVAFCLKVLSERSPLMIEIFNTDCRKTLASMLSAKQQEEQEILKVSNFF